MTSNEYLERFIDCLKNTEFTEKNLANKNLSFEQAIGHIASFFINVKKYNKQVFFIGNGGSAGIATHMSTDFIKNGGIKTQNLYSSSLITCMGNDYGYENIFSKPLNLLFQKNDLLVAISSSGNSCNVINALNIAKEKGGKTITFSGFESNNKIRFLGDYNIYVPISHYGIVESIHNMILQQIVDTILEKDGLGL